MSNHHDGVAIASMELQRRYLLSSFLAMEPPNCLISLARKCGSGSISVDVQEFIWGYCINNKNYEENCYELHLKMFLKKLINEVETAGGTLLDEFYERYAHYMASLKEDPSAKENSWIVKHISFLFHEAPSLSGQWQMVVPLRCSLNMLQGDTGCALWPSSLFLSEFILSFPDVFTRKSCFEVGSGVGLIGVCLNNVRASEAILTDGDASTLANLKHNLEMNKIEDIDASFDRSTSSSSVVQCLHLPWESAKENELLQMTPDIVLGADVTYDPSCLPHLVRVLTILLNRRKAAIKNVNGNVQVSDETEGCSDDCTESNNPKLQVASIKSLVQEMKKGPVALITSVIRNVDTFNTFLNLCCQNNILVRDITESVNPYKLLPYMESYNRSDVHLLLLSYSSTRTSED
ncbi:Protein-lysine N-methyltransferase EEF2KMT [Bienertia sinuspersici]